jgi:hypothetical protein
MEGGAMIEQCEQRGDAWRELRRGRLTGSRVGRAVNGSASAVGALVEELRREIDAGPGGWLAGGNLDHVPDVARGIEQESRALDLWAMLAGVDPYPVGALVHPTIALMASPDALVTLDGELWCVEVKCPRRRGHLAAWTYGMPDEHSPQVQAQILCGEDDGVAGCVFLSYCEDVEPSRRLYVERVPPDPGMQARIVRAVDFVERALHASQKPAPIADIPQLF